MVNHTSLGMHEVARDIAAERTGAKRVLVTPDRWRAGIKFLMGLGTNPELTAKDIARLYECLRGPFANGMNVIDAGKTLVNVMKWERPV